MGYRPVRILELSQSAYDEISDKLMLAGYDFWMGEDIDLGGLGGIIIRREPQQDISPLPGGKGLQEVR